MIKIDKENDPSFERTMIEMKKLEMNIEKLEEILADQSDQIQELQTFKEYLLNRKNEEENLSSVIEVLEIKNSEYKARLSTLNLYVSTIVSPDNSFSPSSLSLSN